MQVRQLMNQPAVTCTPKDTLHHAAGLMWEHDCGALPVIDDNGHITGMITDRDICMAAYTQGRPLHTVPVHEIMTRAVFSVSIDDTIDHAEQVMREHQVRRVPVLKTSGRVVGLLSLNDIVRESERERPQAKREVTTDEVISTIAAVSAPRRARQLQPS